MQPIIHEVGLRDGLQSEKVPVPFETKVPWVEELFKSGVPIIQLGSFVHPEKVPQMADTDRLFTYFSQPGKKPAQVSLSGLVLNEKGLDRGFACGVDLFCMGVSASDTHSKKNTGMGTDEALQRIIPMAKKVVAGDKKVQLSVQSAFGCGFEGVVPETRVLDLLKRFVDAGFTSLSLADTAGHAHPGQVESLFCRAREIAPTAEFTCHLHDTYGMGLANCMAAYGAGVKVFETAFAGLGGCPFTKIAGGNVCTEDLVHCFRRMGLCRDLALDPLINVAKAAALFFGREMTGRVYKTGPMVSPIAK